MASELVRIIWCDVHGKQEKIPAPHSDVVAVGKLRKQLDTCDDCYSVHIEPVLKLLMELGHTVTEFEEPEASSGRKAEAKYFCNACGPSSRGYVRKANYDRHMETEHGLRSGPREKQAPEPTDDGRVVCTSCPDHPRLTKQGYTGHARSKEHKEHLALTA